MTKIVNLHNTCDEFYVYLVSQKAKLSSVILGSVWKDDTYMIHIKGCRPERPVSERLIFLV